MGGQVRIDRGDGVGWIVFDHPERRNAISVEMWRAIPDAVRDLEGDDAVRVVILRGAGEDAFVSGADISEFESSRTAGAQPAYEADTARAGAALSVMEKPLLAMIHGYCVGGGVAIALAADLRYAADDARFGIPAARLGLGYDPHGIGSLVGLVGPSRAKELFFTAKRIGAEDALRMGLVNGVFPKAGLEGAVRDVAATISRNAPLTVRSVKLLVRELAKDPERRDTEAMNRSLRRCFESEDYREGIRAFLEKRPPEFRGR